jgi:hypothetical protein
MELDGAAGTRAERNPWLAGSLGIFFPGLGHLYFGKPELGICWLATIELLWIDKGVRNHSRCVAGRLISRSKITGPGTISRRVAG